MGKHMTTTTHLRKSKSIHYFAFWCLVDIFRGEVNDFIDVQIPRKLDFTHFG
jgi:hypothetical protein